MSLTLSGSGSISGGGTLYTPAQVYAIGDTGPGGGKIFYDAGSTLSWGRYLEAATTSTSPSWTDAQYAWSGNTSNPVGGLSDAIGSGLANTNAMVAQDSTANKAGTVTKAYNGGGKSDWFLPSIDELAQLYAQRGIVGGFANDIYQSSSQYINNARIYDFGGNYRAYWGKNNLGFVRPIRAF